MKKYTISSLMVAIATLFCATVNAQTLNVVSVSPNKGEGINIRFQTVNPNPVADSIHVVVEYGLNPSFTGGTIFLKDYSYTDSFKDITDSLDGNLYNFPAPGTTIFIRLRMYPDTSKWIPLQSGSFQIKLMVRPAAPKITVVAKPYATAKGAVTTLNVSSNVDFALRKYLHFKDSAKVFNSGVIQTLKFTAGTYTVSDTMFNLTQSSWLAYDVVNEVSTVKTGVMRVGQYLAPAKPWGQFDSLVGYANSLHAVVSVVGNTVSGNVNFYYKHEKDATWNTAGPYAFTGNSVEKIAANIPVTKTGKWAVCFSATSGMGTFNSDTFIVDNTQKPASTTTVTPLTAAYNGPGKIKITFRVALTAGEYVDVYAMASTDTTFAVSETVNSPVRVSTNGDATIYMDRITKTGIVWVKLYYITKSGVYVGTVRPYLQVNMQYATGLKNIEAQKVSVYPNPTNAESGFAVSVSKPETMIIFDASGRVVFTKTVADHELVKPALPDGLYSYKLGTQSGRIIFQ